MSDLLEYTFAPDKPTLFRLNWYNEIKIPQLTCALLQDRGEPNLDDRAEMLSNLVKNNIVPALPGRSKALTAEEEMMQIAVRDQVVHARAKVVIMQMMQQLTNPRADVAVDAREMNVREIYEELLKVLRREFPDLVR